MKNLVYADHSLAGTFIDDINILLKAYVDHTVAETFIDDKSLCNVLYTNTLEPLGLLQLYLSSCSGGSLLAFNDFVIPPYGTTVLTLQLEEGESERKVTRSFMVVLCKMPLSGILGRSCIEKLDVVTSPIHLKILYHINDISQA